MSPSVYFFTNDTSHCDDIFADAARRFADVEWRKLQLRSEQSQQDFEAESHTPDIIISFMNPYILPSDLLHQAAGHAYNVHPAIPDYPGNDPHHFAAYDGVYRAGATLHAMIDRVDAGPIYRVMEEDVPPAEGVTKLIERSQELAAQLLHDSLQDILDGSLKQSGRTWNQANRHSRKDFIAMCRLTPDMDKTEVDRRIRAFYHPDYKNKLFMEKFGRRFVYQPARDV